jgi:Domain of unknown function (DUF4747)
MVGKKIKSNTQKQQTRELSFQVSCLNIVLQPHTKQKYIDLFKTIYSSKLDAKVRGDDALMLGSFNRGEGTEGFYVGEFYKFLKLDEAEDWFNTLSMDAASKKDVKTIVIPSHLKPHFKKIPYVFYPDQHKLFFITQKTKLSLSPNMIMRFFENISERPEIAKFGELKATVEPKLGSTKDLFSLPRISHLELEIYKPNPDDHKNLDGDVLDRLKKMNAKKEIIQLFEAGPEGLKPDQQLKNLAKVAASNGEVNVKGRNKLGEIVLLSSKNFPMKVQTTYNPETQSEQDALVEKSEEIRREM